MLTILLIECSYLIVKANGCAFDRKLSQCVQKPSGRLTDDKFVTQLEQCKTVGQGLNVSTDHRCPVSFSNTLNANRRTPPPT